MRYQQLQLLYTACKTSRDQQGNISSEKQSTTVTDLYISDGGLLCCCLLLLCSML